MEPIPPSPRRDGTPFDSAVVVNVPRFGRCALRDLWEAWFLAQDEAERSYREWADAPQRERGEWFARYRAALEREDRAAVVLRAAVVALDLAA